MSQSNVETSRHAAPAARVVREAISRLLQDLARQAERDRTAAGHAPAPRAGAGQVGG